MALIATNIYFLNILVRNSYERLRMSDLKYSKRPYYKNYIFFLNTILNYKSKSFILSIL